MKEGLQEVSTNNQSIIVEDQLIKILFRQITKVKDSQEILKGDTD